MRLFQPGRQPAWWDAIPSSSAGTSLDLTASGSSFLHTVARPYQADLATCKHAHVHALACK